MADIKKLQQQLITQGFSVGPDGADGKAGRQTAAGVKAFQRAHGLPETGTFDEVTVAALAKGTPTTPVKAIAAAPTNVPAAWMPACTMKRIIVHWSAGANTASALDRQHYHIIIQGDGTLVRGNPPISGNAVPARGARASHTLNCNTESIGVSLACMANAIENPFNAGRSPMTRVQWDALVPVLADLCERYSIPVTPQAVLSHAEVQDTLKIQQRGKWDISRLAFDPSVRGAKACGDLFRSRTKALMATRSKVAA